MAQTKYLFRLVLISALIFVVSCDDSEDTSADSECQDICGSDITLQCVRDHFESHGECAVILEADDEPVIRGRQVSRIPYVDLRVVADEAILDNLNGTIRRFCIYKDSGNLIMTVNFEGVFVKAEADYIVGRRGQEPVVIRDFVGGTWPSELTATISQSAGTITPNAVQDTIVSSHIPFEKVDYFIGPKVIESEEPAVQEMLATIMEDVATGIQEIYMTEGRSQFLAYLQKHICNFGVPINNFAIFI